MIASKKKSKRQKVAGESAESRDPRRARSASPAPVLACRGSSSCGGSSSRGEVFSESSGGKTILKDAIVNIFKFLKVEEILSCELVNKAWKKACGDSGLWNESCERLWTGKVYIPPKIRALRITSPREAYVASVIDSRRKYPTKEEFSAFHWRCRFKEDAGEYWTNMDPYYVNTDHTASEFAQTIVRTFNADGSISRLDNFQLLHEGIDSYRWVVREGTDDRLLTVQASFEDNCFPSYLISRHHDNWGFIMQNCWVIWTSFPMPCQGRDPRLDDSKLRIRPENQMDEIMEYNNAFHWPNRNPVEGQADLGVVLTTAAPVVSQTSDDSAAPSAAPIGSQTSQTSQTTYHANRRTGDEDYKAEEE